MGGGRYLGVPPPPSVDRQTPVKTVAYRRTTYAVGNEAGRIQETYNEPHHSNEFIRDQVGLDTPLRMFSSAMFQNLV